MAENRPCQPSRETVCIDTYRVLDSCRDKDCYEDTRVYLPECAQQFLDNGSAVRIKNAETISSFIDIDEVPFNRGFYQLDIRMYIRLDCEICLSPGNSQDFCGISVVEKKVILFGSEGNIKIFKSEGGCSGFCPNSIEKGCAEASNLPIAVLETVDPMVLSYRVIPPHHCQSHASCCDIPTSVMERIGSDLTDGGGNTLAVTLGMFSVVRIERPAQYLIQATEYAVPEKECPEIEDDNPCKMFRRMPFPVGEFYPPSVRDIGNTPQYSNQNSGANNRCGCGGT